MPIVRRVLLVAVCLGITGRGVGWAEPAHPAHVDWVEDPYAPHVTNGTTVRLGTAVGFLHNEGLDVLALGAVTAAGQRWGRLSIEAELAYLTLQAKGTGIGIGSAERLGVLGRFDVIRIGSRWAGANSLACLYIEGGAGVAWNDWDQGLRSQSIRSLPADTKRVEGQAGFGILLDHRLQEPIGFPRRIGWFLGWRMAMSPEDPPALCRSAVCRTEAMPSTSSRVVERSMLFQSSLSVTW